MSRFQLPPGVPVPEGTFRCSQCEWLGGEESRAFRGVHLCCVDFELALADASQSSDPEIAHGLADDILVDIIRWGYSIGELDDRDVPRLIELYDSVPKP